MSEWKRMLGEAVNWELEGQGFVFRIGMDINLAMIVGWLQSYQSQAEAEAGILAQVKRLREMADEIEAALASAPKEG